ncbi:Phenylalanine--tRNA ligase beta subunit [uncultured archaeon]|nr:Phenylalanine--tRNA ligase beta subunit [uncultured archaeon]
MPTVSFNTREVMSLLGGKYTLAELGDRIPMLGVGLERIDAETMEVEVFPNRPDMLSVEGFVRAFKGFVGYESGAVNYKVQPSGVSVLVDSSVDGIRPFIAAGIVEGVKISGEHLKSIMNVQEKLHTTHGRNRVKVAIGIHDLACVKPPFTYKAVAPDGVSFVPLDMSESMTPARILRSHPKGRDYAFTLEGFDRYPVIVDSVGQVLSFPPIINGELTRVTEDSKNLLIEVTGTSQLAVDQALNIVATTLVDQGGKIKFVEIRY